MQRFKKILFFLVALLCPCSGFAQSSLQTFIHGRSISNPSPSSGNQRILIIPIDFPDQPGVLKQSEIYNQFFGTWPTITFKDYFKEVSYNKLNLSGDVVGVTGESIKINLDLISYIRMPHPKKYYVKGVTGLERSFQSMAGAVIQSISQLDSLGFDFSPYANRDGELRNLIIIFPGKSTAETNSEEDFMATSTDISNFQQLSYKTKNGFRYNSFNFCPEQLKDKSQTPVGTCAHEFGHGLGMVDLYDTSGITAGVGSYDLMSYGSYGAGLGEKPFQPSVYTKIFLGWLQPKVIRAGSKRIKLKAVEKYPAAIKLVPQGNTKEYFLLENRQAILSDKEFPQKGLCPGLLIWHVDESIIADNHLNDATNKSYAGGGPVHPGVKLVEADQNDRLAASPINTGECGDSFKVGQVWKGKSARLWDGNNSGFSVKVVSVKHQTMTLKIVAPSVDAKFN